MLTHFFKSINWADVALAVLFARVIFISVRNGFVAEGFKFIGVIVALFISLHFYASFAAIIVKKTTLPLASWQFLIFTGLWAVVSVAFSLLHKGVLILFKVEATNPGVDKYAAGFLGAARAIFLCSLTIFALMLIHHDGVRRHTLLSYGYKITAKAAPNTYKFLYDNFVGKLVEGQQFNADVFGIVGKHGINPK